MFYKHITTRHKDITFKQKTQESDRFELNAATKLKKVVRGFVTVQQLVFF